ncbi:unnamed protein product, partial [Rotaria magnacalcarata]
NSNYNQYKYESEERLPIRRPKRDTTMAPANMNNNRRGGGLQQTEANGKKNINNPSKPITKYSDPQDMDQLFVKRDKLLAQLSEISSSGDVNEDSLFTQDKRSLSTNYSNETKPTNSQDDEDEEGEISESD